MPRLTSTETLANAEAMVALHPERRMLCPVCNGSGPVLACKLGESLDAYSLNGSMIGCGGCDFAGWIYRDDATTTTEG